MSWELPVAPGVAVWVSSTLERVRRGLVWTAVLAGIVMLRAGGDLPGWRAVAGFVVPAGFSVGVAFLIAQDSAGRGRPGMGWLAACVFPAPLAIPAFVFVAVSGRPRGRRGLGSWWALGSGPRGHLSARPAGAAPVLTAAQATVANRCSAAAADRVAASTICLGGAWLLALAGERGNRRWGRPGSGRPAETTT
jgi:hypothetical protein